MLECWSGWSGCWRCSNSGCCCLSSLERRDSRTKAEVARSTLGVALRISSPSAYSSSYYSTVETGTWAATKETGRAWRDDFLNGFPAVGGNGHWLSSFLPSFSPSSPSLQLGQSHQQPSRQENNDPNECENIQPTTGLIRVLVIQLPPMAASATYGSVIEELSWPDPHPLQFAPRNLACLERLCG